MSGLYYNVTTGEVAIGASATRTAFNVTAPANQRVKIKGISVYGKGTNNTDPPVKVTTFFTAANTGGTTAVVTPVKRDGDLGETPQSTLVTYTAEPTAYGAQTVLETRECHPQIGFEIYFPLGEEIVLKGGQIFGVALTAGSAGETMTANLLIEE